MPLLFNIVLEVLVTAIRQEKEIKDIQIGREEVKLSLYADDYRKILKTPQKNIRTKKASRIGYKINIQKSVAFLYTNNKISERESKKKKSPLKSEKKPKKLIINLTKEVKDLYTGNYKTLIQEIHDDTKKWKVVPYSWIERINTVKNGTTTQSNLQI